ncbi:MAG TPA: acid phosphatase, partial [Phycisphaerales bacterium]|nr:acid phosphatase [Phycisphaerales bacterium]
QGFNVARFHLAEAIATHKPENKPLAVITDVDDTILLSTPYWGYLVTEGKDFFDDSAWDSWIRNNSTVASPGALEFLRYCYTND